MIYKIKVEYPVTKKDFEEITSLVENNLFKQKGLVEELKNASVGEVLIVKDSGQIIGMLHMKRPGKIFDEIEDRYFDPNNIESNKEKIGYIALVSVKKDVQGKGIGKNLVEMAIELQREWGAHKIIAHASQNSPGDASEKLFRSFSFSPTKLHKDPWNEYSKKQGPDKFWCKFCGNPCSCDELEMVKDLL